MANRDEDRDDREDPPVAAEVVVETARAEVIPPGEEDEEPLVVLFDNRSTHPLKCEAHFNDRGELTILIEDMPSN